MINTPIHQIKLENSASFSIFSIFSTFTNISSNMWKAIITVLVLCLFSFSAQAQVSGKVFKDYNGNGTQGTAAPNLEVGVPGIFVNAYNSADVLLASYTTNATGNYAIPNSGAAYNGTQGSNTGFIAANTDVRIEFVVPNTTTLGSNTYQGFAAPSGSANASSVQFVKASATATNVSFAINKPADYTDANPKVGYAIMVEGNQMLGAHKDKGILFNMTYSQGNVMGNDSTGKFVYTTAKNLGTTFGLAHQRSSNSMFASAFMKRHAGFGPAGSGAIYRINTTTNAISTFLNFNTIYGAGFAGTDPHPTNTSVSSWDKDSVSWDKVGKISFGDIDISEDEQTLWAISLTDRKLYKLPLGSATNPVAPTAAQITSYPASGNLTGLAGLVGSNLASDIRPFALGIKNGMVYVGMVHSAQTSGLASEMRAFVYEFNPNTAVFTKILDFPLDYTRGRAINANGTFVSANWNPWKTNFTVGSPIFSNEFAHPQPILSDINFLENEMILGFKDRFGDQMGYLAMDPLGNNNAGSMYCGDAAGDILFARQGVSGVWALENNSNSVPAGGFGPTAGAGTNQGPGGGEFVFAEKFPVSQTIYNDPTGANYIIHDEVALGGVAAMPGSDEIVTTIFDPVDNINTAFDGGIAWYNMANGTRKRAFWAYDGGSSTAPFFGKANAMGDIEILSAPAPIEIGNRVWNDWDKDGIQDAGEPGIGNIEIELFADFNNDNMPDGTALGDVDTDNSIGSRGTWYFNASNVTDGDPSKSGNQAGLVQGKKYLVRIAATDWSGTVGAGDLSGLYLSPANSTLTPGQQDHVDSDATLVSGFPQIGVTLGMAGQNDHTLDFGFGTYAQLGNYVWNDLNSDGINNDGVAAGINGVKVRLYKDDGAGNYVLLDSATTANNGANPGYYLFNTLIPGNYKVQFVAPTGKNLTITNQTANVDNNSDADGIGWSGIIPIAAGAVNLTIDAGFVNACVIGDVLYIGGNVKPGDADAYDRGMVQYLQGLGNTVTFVLAKTTSGLGLHNPNTNAQLPITNFLAYDAIIVSPTTEGVYLPALRDSIKETRLPVMVSDYWISPDISLATGAGFDFTNFAHNGVSAVKIYEYQSQNPTASYTPGLFWADYYTNASTDLWLNAGAYGDGSQGVYFVYEPNDVLPMGSATPLNNHGRRVFYGIHANGIYQNPVNGGSVPTPSNMWLAPYRHFAAAGKRYLDSALYALCTTPAPAGSLGNYVWSDLNGDGINNEAASAGINGIKVKLYQDNGLGSFILIDSTITANNGANPGYYSFTGLGSWTYRVVFPTTYIGASLTTQTATAATDNNSDPNVITGVSPNIVINATGTGFAKNNPTIDAGYYLCTLSTIASLTINTIAHGPQAAPQPETVTLNGGTTLLPENNVAGFYSSSSSEGAFYTVCSEISQPILPLQNPYTHEQTGSTNGFTATQAYRLAQVFQAAGFNSQTGLGAGNNTITNMVALQLASWNALYDTDYNVISGSFRVLTTNNAGSATLANTWLAAAQAITTPTLVVHKLRNATGQDLVLTGDVPPITVQVTPPTCSGVGAPNNAGMTILGFTAGQRYQYSTGLTFNSGAAIPASPTTIPVGGLVVNNLSNTTQSYTVRIYDVTNNACFTDRVVTINSVVCVGSVGNYVWYDANGNGTQDVGETGINGVTVELYKETSAGSGTYTLSQTTTTANNGTNNGAYNFVITQSANYYVRFPITANGTLVLSLQTVTAATDGNSDANSSTGNSPIFAINIYGTGVAKDNPTIDAGYKCNTSASISAQTNVSCFGGTNGSATATVTGGTSPYTYTWNTTPVQYTATATNLAAGIYTVTVKDANNCSTSASVTIIQPATVLNVTISSQTNVTCAGGATGSATVTASGGISPYTYLWNTSPPQSTATATGLIAGTYTVLLTDANGCGKTTNVTISTLNNAPPCVPITIIKTK